MQNDQKKLFKNNEDNENRFYNLRKKFYEDLEKTENLNIKEKKKSFTNFLLSKNENKKKQNIEFQNLESSPYIRNPEKNRQGIDFSFTKGHSIPKREINEKKIQNKDFYEFSQLSDFMKNSEVSENIRNDNYNNENENYEQNLSKEAINDKKLTENLQNIDFTNLRFIRDKIHHKQLKKDNYDLESMLDKLPMSIDEITQIKEAENPLKDNLEPTEIDKEIMEYGPIEYSILKGNYFHLDEKQDLDFYKDLSSYSRKVFKDPRYDAKSLQVLDYTDLNLKDRLDNLSDNDILEVAGNFISEAILESTLRDYEEKEDKLIKYQMNLKIGDKLHKIGPKGPSAIKKILKTESAAQTISDVTIAKNQINKKTNLQQILNNVLKLKNFKKPLEDLPSNAVMIKKIKRETKERVLSEYIFHV